MIEEDNRAESDRGMTIPKGTEIRISISEGARPMLIRMLSTCV